MTASLFKAVFLLQLSTIKHYGLCSAACVILSFYLPEHLNTIIAIRFFDKHVMCNVCAAGVTADRVPRGFGPPDQNH